MKEQHSLRIRDLLRPHRSRLIAAILSALAASAAGLLPPLIMKQMVDVALPRKDFSLLTLSLISLVLLPVLSTLLSMLTERIHHRIGGTITDLLKISMMSRLLRQAPEAGNAPLTGDHALRFGLADRIGDHFITRKLLPVIPQTITFLTLCGIMVGLDPVLAVFSLMLSPLAAFMDSLLERKAEDASKQRTSVHESVHEAVQRLPEAVRTVQLLTREHREGAEFREHIRRLRGAENQWFTVRLWRQALSSLGKVPGLFILISVSLLLMSKDRLTVGTLLAFTVYFPQLPDIVRQFRSVFIEYKHVKGHLEAVTETLNLPVRDDDAPDARELHRARGEIEFRNVTCTLPSGDGVKNLSLRIHPGEFIGIVGPDDASQSIIPDLLLRFREPDEGEILLDGRNIREYRLVDLRKRIGLVTRKVYLWERSIRENLLCANPDAAFDELVDVCGLTRLTSMLDSLPDGWDTITGKDGVNLSDEEKHRVAIARTLLRKPDILLLEEPPSTDATAGSRLFEELDPVLRDKTVIVTAHRLPAIRHADRILVIENGKLTESGTHDELLKNRSAYWRLHHEPHERTGEEERVG
ncbi:ABC transporter ATP-binding protein [Staphylospora marina]|uniref:ABC transporter ATP-binding protein n=1 Tax=Staphylospora marina TaxID=2490858 RepID=UPI0013DE0D74|nr:ABC transporter ATP-binding protein [Staphylospora marina]